MSQPLHRANLGASKMAPLSVKVSEHTLLLITLLWYCHCCHSRYD